MLLAALLSFVRSYIQSWRYPVHVILVESTYNVQFKLPRNYQNYLCELPRTKRAELTRIYISANYLCVLPRTKRAELPRIIFRRITEPYSELTKSLLRVSTVWSRRVGGGVRGVRTNPLCRSICQFIWRPQPGDDEIAKVCFTKRNSPVVSW